MRRLARGKIDRQRTGSLGARAQRLLVALTAGASAGALGVACSSDPVALVIAPAGPGTGTAIPETDAVNIERCGADGQLCAEGCCTAGNICSQFGRCIPQMECSDSSDCSADSQCAGGECRPFDILPDGFRFNRTCRTEVDLPSVIPTVQCQWPGDTRPAEFPDFVQVIGTPMVVDFDSDNDPSTVKPSIVFISYTGDFNSNTGVIRVVDGETCALQDTIEGQFPFTPRVPLALADVNNDGRPDIIAADEEPLGAAIRSGVVIFELASTGPTPTFRPMANGRVQSSGTGRITGFSVHDIDNDDFPEIFTEKTMLRWDTQQNRLVDASGLQLPGRPVLTMIEPPTVTDVDGDRIAEVLMPQGILSWDRENLVFVDKSRGGLQPLWNDNPDDNQGAFMAAADLGEWATGLPQGIDSTELVIVGHNGNIWVRSVDGQTRFLMQTAGLAGGPPVIADVDGDGRMEFASGGRDKVTVFDLDCTRQFYNERGCRNGQGEASTTGVAWQATTQGAQSGVAVFDFDGDGRSEVVYADQCFMRVYDGGDGSVLFSAPRMSTTQWEYPVVVDTDGDGFSEIVTASNNNDRTVVCPDVDPQNRNTEVQFEAVAGITVWREAQDRWAGSRPIWNQHNYFVTNVRDDGTVPPMGQVQTHWEEAGPNTFRQNVQGTTGRSLSLADVTTAGDPTVQCLPAQGLAKVQVDLCNRGAGPLRANETEIALVNSDRPTEVLCQQRNTEPLDPGRCMVIDCDIAVPPRAEPFDVLIMGDPTDQVRECYEANNRSLISRVSCVPDNVR